MAGIRNEDTSLVERAKVRWERFEGYSDRTRSLSRLWPEIQAVLAGDNAKKLRALFRF